MWIRPPPAGALPRKLGRHAVGREQRQGAVAQQRGGDGVDVDVVRMLMGDEHGVGAGEGRSVSEKVPGSSTSTRPSFSSRTQAWVNFVSFIRPA